MGTVGKAGTTTTEEPDKKFIRVKPAASPSLPSSQVGDTGFQILLFVFGQTSCLVLNGDWGMCENHCCREVAKI